MGNYENYFKKYEKFRPDILFFIHFHFMTVLCIRNPSDVALDVRLCQQMDTKNMGNYEKEQPIRQCSMLLLQFCPLRQVAVY